MEIGWNPWGFLPQSLPQWDGCSLASRVIMAEMKKVIVCARMSRRTSRATEMQALLRHARPHGGNAAKRVKQVRPNNRSV